MYNKYMNAKEARRRVRLAKSYNDHPKILKRGDTRDDGMVFYRYHISAKGFEHWMTPEKFTPYREKFLQCDISRRKKPCVLKKINKGLKKRYKSDALYRLKALVSTRTSIAFRLAGYKKNTKTTDMLGCSYKELYKHIEDQFTDGMSWDRMGEIHIDHRLPLAAGETEDEVLVLAHHRNLQPMWAHDNLSKGDKCCPKELKKYLTKYL